MQKRFSKKRQQILDTLKAKQRALTAAELHAALPEMNLTTIYRNLELFTSEKVIRKLQLGTQEARYEYQAKPHHHAVCETCERVIHFTAPDDKIKKLLGLEDFEIDELEVTVRGRHRHHPA
jgi:Fe2+ or Zn2+ uptake regulation protein